MEINDGDTILVQMNDKEGASPTEITKAMREFEKKLEEVGFHDMKVLVIDSTTNIEVVRENMQAQKDRIREGEIADPEERERVRRERMKRMMVESSKKGR